MSKHTPGPWVATKGKLGFPIVASEQYEVASLSFCGENLGSLRGKADKRAEMIANARLIAAAPDTLEMCKRFETLDKNASRAGNRVFIDVRDWDAFMSYNRAAIAKAEGRS